MLTAQQHICYSGQENTVEYTTVRKFAYIYTHSCTRKEKKANEIKTQYKGNLHSW